MYRIKKHKIFHISLPPLDRIAALARLGQEVFHASDLANLWQIRDPNTLYTTLKRYTQKGLIFRIHKGMYSIRPLDEIDPLLLGVKALHRFAYVSTETMLAQYGVIQQKITAITLVSDISKRFSIGSHHYVCRKLKDRYLYNTAGTVTQNSVRRATLARAVADMLYFNLRAYFDNLNHIDWDAVRVLQKKIGYPLTPSRYVSSKTK
ncbi:hypothetical protein A3B21_01220 [Candidatus Uhrbacteria bacterium RIFCSPLOWO2_01_FULL_47_24]|uniref:AbiEi antitoxin C-terminal domain-containing protein n=1 Tax=Candidatus Uhrbacteria bacterium RIFCSPLOWO2_01_FULL_47_24 TaxID=1802401 RepID=A0A1F7US03_9BACT|nr:MAG: hypothetical protein A2753_03500 [Candidatus Uhrbacteria bacterium RIFCSPHIGHO2_01_FULL_47_11]OGL67724.1 MAG: hypothetical protein A3D58_00980 [Candidatus Uhrbacteria bacterium RIFCSPHIGHO2_02_FULL_46_47]OGL75666.1 MAG: hypothetical protein A3F52_04675 [Candidatus Uhrbacteria bacterium RIFCSPHIGHO2_12_FULL_47_11]OGL81015.1 MAG: hypothetical protein A3B21_01220 [Candidatus Uhrbacteria bacterium RIFCSPLOWO2_01_FULL_47_24]OGL84316.1 MAG: hypothetical protein A3J03_00280 [Candidatus Uhrbact